MFISLSSTPPTVITFGPSSRIVEERKGLSSRTGASRSSPPTSEGYGVVEQQSAPTPVREKSACVGDFSAAPRNLVAKERNSTHTALNYSDSAAGRKRVVICDACTRSTQEEERQRRGQHHLPTGGRTSPFCSTRGGRTLKGTARGWSHAAALRRNENYTSLSRSLPLSTTIAQAKLSADNSDHSAQSGRKGEREEKKRAAGDSKRESTGAH